MRCRRTFAGALGRLPGAAGSAGGGEFRNENAEPVDSRPVAGGSGSAGVAGAGAAKRRKTSDDEDEDDEEDEDEDDEDEEEEEDDKDDEGEAKTDDELWAASTQDKAEEVVTEEDLYTSPIGLGTKRWIDTYRSLEDGASWQYAEGGAEDTGVGNPPSMILLNDGRICLTYGFRASPYGIRARISSDHGRTWGEEIILRDDGSGPVSYTHLTLPTKA